MVLKEAFRLQNHLSELIQQVQLFLAKKDNVFLVRQEHLRSKSNPKAENEVIEVRRETEMVPDRVIDLYLDLLNEKEQLSGAISAAKAGAELDMDASISINKLKQEAITRLAILANQSSSESQDEGRDYMINVDGNQTPYHYTIKTVRTIDYDRTAVRGIVRRLRRETNDVSSKIDYLNVTLEVDYQSKYDLDDTFEEAYEKFIG